MGNTTKRVVTSVFVLAGAVAVMFIALNWDAILQGFMRLHGN
jgi:hypothetical protein